LCQNRFKCCCSSFQGNDQSYKEECLKKKYIFSNGASAEKGLAIYGTLCECCSQEAQDQKIRLFTQNK
jgi:hypothetical protein